MSIRVAAGCEVLRVLDRSKTRDHWFDSRSDINVLYVRVFPCCPVQAEAS